MNKNLFAGLKSEMKVTTDTIQRKKIFSCFIDDCRMEEKIIGIQCQQNCFMVYWLFESSENWWMKVKHDQNVMKKELFPVIVMGLSLENCRMKGTNGQNEII